MKSSSGVTTVHTRRVEVLDPGRQGHPALSLATPRRSVSPNEHV